MNNNLLEFKNWINKAVSEQEVQAATSRGLVPASGDPYKPYRWIKRGEGQQQGQEEGDGQQQTSEHEFTIEDVFINDDGYDIDAMLENINSANDSLKNSGDENSDSVIENNNRIAYLFDNIKKFGREELGNVKEIDNIKGTLEEISEFTTYLSEVGRYVSENYEDVDDSFHDSIEQYKRNTVTNYGIVNNRMKELEDMKYGYNELFPYNHNLIDNIGSSIKQVLSEPQTEDVKDILSQNSQTLRIARALDMAYGTDDVYDSYEPDEYNKVSENIKDLIFALGEMKVLANDFMNEGNQEMASKAKDYAIDINDVLGEKEEILDSLEPEEDEEILEERNNNNIEFFEDSFDYYKEMNLVDRMIKDTDSDDTDEIGALNFIKYAVKDLYDDLESGEMYKYRGVKDNNNNSLQSFASVSSEYYPSGKEFHIDKIVTLPSLYRKKGQSPTGGMGAGSGVKLLTDLMVEFVEGDADVASLEPLNEHVKRGYRRFGFKGEEWDLDMVAKKEDVIKSLQRISRYIAPRLEETGKSHILDINKQFNKYDTLKKLYKNIIMEQIHDMNIGTSQWMPVYNIKSPLYGKYILINKRNDGSIRIDGTYVV